MRRAAFVTVCAAVVLAAAATAAADAILLKSGLPYEPVVITNVSGGLVTFKLGARSLTKALADVDTITLSDNGDFNRGESLLKDRKFAEAAAAYRAADASARKPWQKSLVSYRLLAAAETAGQIEEAVTRWLKLVDADKAGAGSLKLRPKNLAPAKSKANDRAAALLEAKAKAVKDPAYLRAIYTLLAELYTQQGQFEKARALAAKLAGAATNPKPPNGNGGAPVVVAPGNGGKHADLLRLAALSLKSKRHADVVKQIKPRLKEFSAVELPSGLYLLGLAELQMAKAEKKAAQRKTLLLQAGLRLMRVVVFFGDSDEAAGALLAAGEVNELLGNADGARQAYRLLVKSHAKSPAAAEARKRLAVMDKKKGG